VGKRSSPILHRVKPSLRKGKAVTGFQRGIIKRLADPHGSEYNPPQLHGESNKAYLDRRDLFLTLLDEGTTVETTVDIENNRGKTIIPSGTKGRVVEIVREGAGRGIIMVKFPKKVFDGEVTTFFDELRGGGRKRI